MAAACEFAFISSRREIFSLRDVSSSVNGRWVPFSQVFGSEMISNLLGRPLYAAGWENNGYSDAAILVISSGVSRMSWENHKSRQE